MGGKQFTADIFVIVVFVYKTFSMYIIKGVGRKLKQFEYLNKRFRCGLSNSKKVEMSKAGP